MFSKSPVLCTETHDRIFLHVMWKKSLLTDQEKNTVNPVLLFCFDYDCGLTCSMQTNIT